MLNNILFDYDKGLKYKVYIGLKDKCKKRQIINTNKACTVVNQACNKYLSAFTLLNAIGDCNNEFYKLNLENTLIIETINPEIDKLNLLVDFLISELNQDSILVEVEEIKYKFYK